MRDDVTFTSDGERCAAWHYRGEGPAFERPGGRPCAVMAHGFGYTRDSGLERYAERLAAAGLDVLLFDYRTFGASSGEPRHLVDWRRHRADYTAAVAFARGLDGVDPDRIVLWGTSYSGGHVIAVAAADRRVAAVIAQVPATDGLAAVIEVGRYAGPLALLRLTGIALRDLAAAARGTEAVRLPVVGPPGSAAAMTPPDAEPGSRAIAGPSFANEFCARAILGAALNRPVRRARELRCPLLVQIADHDTVAPPAAAERAARRAGAGAEVLRYPVHHFDVYGGEARERCIADQLDFLRRRLAAA